MQQTDKTIDLKNADPTKFRKLKFSHDYCLTCGLCSSSCPVSGIDGFDPRKLIRFAILGLEQKIVESRWPWICTLCGKCEHDCPMEINIPGLVRHIRSLRNRDLVPGILHKGIAAALNTGNNLGLPKEDFIFILEDVGEEIAEEIGFDKFNIPIDIKGANLLTTIHNKLVNTHTEDLKHWWKIFHAAKEDWTVPSQNWEGTNWGYFTGDDTSMKKMTGRIAEHMKKLAIKNLMWPE